MAHIDATIHLSVDDKSRHWAYFQKDRSAVEKQTSVHKTDYGGSSVVVTQPIYDGRGIDLS